jgi:2-polyprenyl-3-methyl-5-hydroxy-6-metoxy-1,4-benzoquinol methylase
MTTLPSLTTERRSAYTGTRPGLLRQLPPTAGPILDIGCSDGTIGAAVKARDGIEVWGVELDDALADIAETRLDRVIRGPVEEALDRPEVRSLAPSAIILADVLEHTTDPWGTYDKACQILQPGGYVLVSLPNVAHWDTHWNLLRGNWPHRDRGIHDLGHLRFFARRDVEALMRRNEMTLESHVRKYRLRESSSKGLYLAAVAGRLWPNGFTFQFVARARKA